jgi:hypothetical protein
VDAGPCMFSGSVVSSPSGWFTGICVAPRHLRSALGRPWGLVVPTRNLDAVSWLNEESNDGRSVRTCRGCYRER